jgi:hypothetical protein
LWETEYAFHGDLSFNRVAPLAAAMLHARRLALYHTARHARKADFYRSLTGTGVTGKGVNPPQVAGLQPKR